MKNVKLLVFLILVTLNIFGQNTKADSLQNKKNVAFKYKALIIPTVLIGYGIVGIESDGLKSINSGIKQEINEHIDEKFTIDDISQ